MSDKLVVTGADGIMWDPPTRLTDQAYRIMRQEGLVPPGDFNGLRVTYLDEIAEVFEGKHIRSDDLNFVARKAANRCIDRSNFIISEMFRRYDRAGALVVAMSSALNVLVEVAVSKYNYAERTHVKFSNTLTSQLRYADQHFTGEIAPLDKASALRAYMGGLGLDMADVVLINGRDDVRWASKLAREVVLVNPSEGLQRAARDSIDWQGQPLEPTVLYTRQMAV